MDVEIRRLGPGDGDVLPPLAAESARFDGRTRRPSPNRGGERRELLASDDDHMLVAAFFRL